MIRSVVIKPVPAQIEIPDLIAETEEEILALVRDRDPSTHGL